MNDFPQDKPRYTRILAAELANITLEFLERCEVERLIDVRIISGDQPGYSARDVRHLILIRSLYEDLEIDFPALEVVLNMRRQLLDLQAQLEAFERQATEREQRLRRELVNLRRRFADEADWV
jgi:hypothetical protein